MAPIRIEASALASVMAPAVGGLTLVSGCASESAVLADAVKAAGSALGDRVFTGVFLPGLNRRVWRAGPKSRTLSFFMTPQLAMADAVDFLPLPYSDILALLRDRQRPDTALMMVSPPDPQGWCSFGPTVDFMAELWPQIPIRIAHINPAMPRTPGHRGVPFSALTAYIEAEQPLLTLPQEAADPAALAIAGHIAEWTPDAATLQIGLGKIPGAVLRRLTGHRNLRLHSGLVGDGVLELMAAGALAPGRAVTVGVAVGGAGLYERLTDPVFNFQPVSVTHDPLILGAQDRLVTINSALAVDLFGQGYAELGPRGLISGPGGATDFARGAKIAGGLRLLALPAAADEGRISRIVAIGAGPVSLARSDIDVVVTEHGAADLRDQGYDARAKALIAIAAPQHRDPLSAAWAEQRRRL